MPTKFEERYFCSSDIAMNTKFKCPECPKEYARLGQFQGHVKKHRGKPHKCNLCDAAFKLKSNLVLHEALHYTSDPTCPECGKKFSRMSSLKAHLMFHERSEDSDEHSFSGSDDEFDSGDYKNDSDYLVLEEEFYECKQCPMNFNDAALLEKHKEVHQKLKIALSVKKHRRRRSEIKESEFQHECKACGKKFQKMCQLSRHILIHTGERPFKCDLCKKTFNQKSVLESHKTTLHDTDRPHSCSFCPLVCAHKGNLRKHVMSAHSGELSADELRVSCDYCNCSFRKSHALNSHVLRVHTNYFTKEKDSPPKGNDDDDDSHEMVGGGLKREKVPDQETKKSISTYHKLERQLKVVLEKADINVDNYARGNNSSVEYDMKDKARNLGYKCGSDNTEIKQEPPDFEAVVKSMPERYKILAGDSSHAFENYIFREDDGVNFYGCTHCFKEYKSLRTLVTHICPNVPQETYRCAQCTSTFSSKQDLECHMKIHFQNKELKCHVCDKKFSDEDTLKTHSFIHPEFKTYKCSLCSENFHTSRHRRNHFISQCKISPPKILGKVRSPYLPFKESSVVYDIKSLKPPFDHSFFENNITSGTSDSEIFLASSDSELDNCLHEGPSNCLWCNKAFVSNKAYSIHLVAHASIKRFRCILCDSVFFTEMLLKDHINMHENIL